MHSFCINVGSVFTGYVGQISIFYPALPDSELKNTWTNEIRQSKSSTVCYKNYFNMRALLCEEVALDQVGLHNKNSVRSHSGNVRNLCLQVHGLLSVWMLILLLTFNYIIILALSILCYCLIRVALQIKWFQRVMRHCSPSNHC